MSDPERAIVLLSGGIDSAVALFWAAREGYRLWALEFEYHLRPARERACAADLARKAGATRLTVPVPFLREAQDLTAGTDGVVPLRLSPRGYIPARNLVFYSVAGYYAEALGARTIVGGHNREDALRFPDASRDFFGAVERLFAQALWTPEGRALTIALPLAEKDKAETVRLGLSLGVPFASTWSCYEDGPAACGGCPSCQERARAFAACALADPSR